MQGDSIRGSNKNVETDDRKYFYTNSRGTHPGNLDYESLPDESNPFLYAAYYNPYHINTRLYKIFISITGNPMSNEICPINTAVKYFIRAIGG